MQYYRQVRIEQCTDEHRKRLFECVKDSITYDELDYYLKANLRVPPEQRYQHKKEAWYFHELSYLQQTRDGNGRFVDVVKDYGCGHWSTKREEVLKKPNELIGYYREKNAIIDIEVPKEPIT